MENTLDSRLIYCDKYMAVVNKIPGEVCSNNDDDTSKNPEGYLPDVFKALIVAQNGTEPESIECVNRVDKPVSGLVIMALGKDSAGELGNQLKMGKMIKKYYAIVEGIYPVSHQPELLSDYIRFNTKTRKSYICSKKDKNAKKAELTYQVLGAGERYSFLKVELLTGRTHQIRCQLAGNKMYIKGDLKYGARRSEKLGGIRLHAGKLSLFHPKTGKMMSFSAPFPYEDALWTAFKDLLKEK